MRRLAIGLLATLAGITMIGSAASAQDTDSDTGSTEPTSTIEAGTVETGPVDNGTIDVARVDVLQVSGLFDPILLDSVRDRDRATPRRTGRRH